MAFSQPLIQIRGTQLKPYYSKGSSSFTTVKTSATSVDATVDFNAIAFGGKVLNFTASSAATGRLLAYSLSGGNAPSTRAMSFLIRIIPQWTGNPAAIQYFFQLGFAPFYSTYVVGWITTTGKFFFQVISANGTTNINYTSVASLSFTSGTPTDIMVTTDGTGNTGSIKLYQDGSLVESATPNGNNATWNSDSMMFLQLGAADTAATNRTCNYLLIEFCIFDSVQAAYSPRADFVASPNANGDTVPAAADVRTGVASGLATGSCAVPGAASVLSSVAVDATVGTYVTTTAAQTQHGVTFGAGGALTGTYRGYDLWQAVAANHLYNGDVKLQDGVTVTGTDQGFDFNDLVDPATLKIGTRIANHGIFVTGTYDGSDRWTALLLSQVASGVTFLSNGVQVTGTLGAVTNVIQAATLVGQSTQAVLEAHD